VPLAEVQHQIRNAVISGHSAPIAPRLVGGIDPSKRLDIHLRHYEASLTAAVVGRFPATVWLIGARRLEQAARRFVHEHPPTAPCIAEYGAAFPDFLAAWPDTAHLAYVPAFADLDWHLGRIAVSVDVAAVTRAHVGAITPTDLANMAVQLQAGTHYLEASWPIDTLITMCLTDASPEAWMLTDDEVHLEVRGARGSFRFSRLIAADYAFRASLSAGRTLGDAAAHALSLNSDFEPGAALIALLDEQLMTSIGRTHRGDQS
jgi:hypothetical protein